MAQFAVVEIWDDVFNPVYVPYLDHTARIQILFGGSSSGKSRFQAQRVIEDLLAGDRNYLILRAVQNTIRSSVFNELKQVIRQYDVIHLFKINKSEMTITCENGFQAILKGLDDPEKVKSIVPEQGVLTDVWIEEATEISEEDFNQLNKRLRGITEGKKKRIVLTFNPILKTHWIYKKWFITWDDEDTLHDTDDLLILKTTYKDNSFLEADDIKALEDESDEYFYNVYTLGKWGMLGDIIFKNWKKIDLCNNPISKTFDMFKHGLDFGYSNDPTAYNKIYYHRASRSLYIVKEWTSLEVTNDEIALSIESHLDGDYVVCDSAEPKSIKELNNHEVKAIGAVKGKDSIMHGIQWLKQQTIYISKECVATIGNFQQYHWKKDKDGNTLNVPVDKFNDHLDAIRYAMEDEMLMDHGFVITSGESEAAKGDW